MVNINTSKLYLGATICIILLNLSFSVILFGITLILSLITCLVIYLELKVPLVERDYELFKENRPIDFIKPDSFFSHYVRSTFQNELLTSVNRVDFNQPIINEINTDNQLNEIIEIIFDQHIYSWFNLITTNRDFPNKLYQFFIYTISSFAKRLSNVDVANLVTTKFVDKLIKHQRLYRVTKDKLSYKIYTNDEFVDAFFHNERRLEKTYSRKNVCLNQDQLISFLSRISETLQYLLYPYNCFNVEPFKHFTKEIFVKTVLFPLLDILSEPDFINGIIVSLFKSNLPSTETFISVVQSIDDIEELKAVLVSVEEEILFVRSKDDTDDDLKMKQQLNSLLYLKKIILSHLKKFANDEDQETADGIQSSQDGHNEIFAENKNTSISFDIVLRHNVALEYFIDYMSSKNAANYINFYINVESFKISVEQVLFQIFLKNINDDSVSDDQSQQFQQSLHEAACNIFETYLSDGAPSRLTMVDHDMCHKVGEILQSHDPALWMKDCLFDEIFYQVRALILKHPDFFPSFRKSRYYTKLLVHSKLAMDSCEGESEAFSNSGKSLNQESFTFDVDESFGVSEEIKEDLKSIDNSATGSEPRSLFGDSFECSTSGISVDSKHLSNDSEEGDSTNETGDHVNCFNIDIVETGSLNQHGKTYVAYLINVENFNDKTWVTLRRYSEFFVFHQLIVDKCEKINGFNLKTLLSLPPKTIFGNRTNPNVVRYRRCMLSSYLKKLNMIYNKFPFLCEDIENFLQPGSYNKNIHNNNITSNKSHSLETSTFNPPKIAGLMNPIKTLSNAMKNGSDNILDGFQKLSRTLSLQPTDLNKSSENSVLKSPNYSKNLGSFNARSKLNTQKNCKHFESNKHFTNQQRPSSTSSSEDYSPSSQSSCNDESDFSNLDSKSVDNIPLLMLLDEVFDLKSENFWLRRRIIDLFKQIVEVTYTDTINKKMVDYINEWTSPIAISEYIKLLKNSLWPNGKLAQSVTRKPEDILRRKVAVKALILTCFSDLRKVIGNDTLQSGLMSFCETFQNKTLNLRLVLVVFELVLEEIFPNNYFKEICTRLHTSTDTTSVPISSDWPPYLSKFVARS